jgi:hypothetical protein
MTCCKLNMCKLLFLNAGFNEDTLLTGWFALGGRPAFQDCICNEFSSGAWTGQHKLVCHGNTAVQHANCFLLHMAFPQVQDTPGTCN